MSGSSGSIWAVPNPILPEDSALPGATGQTTLSWSAEGAAEVEIRVGTPDGPLFCRSAPQGQKTTGDWVHNGLTFYLQDVSGGVPLDGDHTLATVTVSVFSDPAPTADPWRRQLVDLVRNGCQPDQRLFAKLSTNRDNSIVVLGSLGAVNVGDEAILLGVVRGLLDLDPSLDITILVENPELGRELIGGLPVRVERSLHFLVQRFLDELPSGRHPADAIADFAAELQSRKAAVRSGCGLVGIPDEFMPALQLLMCADGVVDCGGANLSPWWKPYFYEKCLCYRIAAKPLLISGQEVDPLDDLRDVKLLTGSFACATEITLRDPISAAYLTAIGCPGVFHITGDDAMTLGPSNDEVLCTWLDNAGIASADGYVAFHYRHYMEFTEDGVSERITEYVEQAAEICGLPILGVPMHFGTTDERVALAAIKKRLRHSDRFHYIDQMLAPSDAKGLFARARLTFGIGGHAGILSLGSGRPFLGLYRGAHYSLKMNGLAKIYDFPDLLVPIDQTSPEDFRQKFGKIWARQEEISPKLQRRTAVLSRHIRDARARFLAARTAVHSPQQPILTISEGSPAVGPAGGRPCITDAAILMYHRIADSDLDPWALCVTPNHFAEHLQLIRRDYYPMTLTDYIRRRVDGTVPRGAIIITFDDGYGDNWNTARPLLERNDVPATFFVVSGGVEQRGEFWWDELEAILLRRRDLPESLSLNLKGTEYVWHLDKDEVNNNSTVPYRFGLYREVHSALKSVGILEREEALDHLRRWAGAGVSQRAGYRTLTSSELMALGRTGWAEIGAHTVTHPFLPALASDEHRREIQEGKLQLEELLDRPVTSLAYPYGAYTPHSAYTAREAGF